MLLKKEEEIINDGKNNNNLIIKNFFDKKNFKNNLRENKNSIILYILFTVYIIAISAIFLKLLILPNFTLIDIKENNIENKHKYIDSNLNI